MLSRLGYGPPFGMARTLLAVGGRHPYLKRGNYRLLSEQIDSSMRLTKENV